MESDFGVIKSKCAQYLLEEPQADLRSEMLALLNLDNRENRLELTDRMLQHLRFGTAGLRGRMESGYNRLNSVSVYRFGYALGQELDFAGRGAGRIVIGYDARENSRAFAIEVAEILGALGAEICLFEQIIPTPLCAYATKSLAAVAGVMITASHNPSYDNGIKLYDTRSVQVSGPLLSRIETAMENAPLRCDFRKIHRKAIADLSMSKLGDDIIQKYYREIQQTDLISESASDRDVEVVYTPIHGVGKKFFLNALASAGFCKVSVVPAQSEPDSKFPTVAFPNPEEKHTLDLAHQLATDRNCQWVFANDPDADRLQVSSRNPDGSFRKLSGNEMGSILGYFSILRAKERGVRPLLASSIVSSRMLQTMCKQMGADYSDGLTGFSNIIDRAMKHEISGKNEFVFGYEEAIGFLIGKVVLDKDGINAGVRFMEIAGYLKQINKTVWQLLDELYVQFGLFVNDQWSMRFDGLNAMNEMEQFMVRVRDISPSAIAKILGLSDCDKSDLLTETKNANYDGLRANVVIFEIERLMRLIVRPSGTEPKIKFYLELTEGATNQEALSNKRSILEMKIAELRGKLELLLAKS